MGDVICKWRVASITNLKELVEWLPKKRLHNDEFKQLMDSAFRRTGYQLACQLGLYYIDESNYYIPRFTHNLNDNEAREYLHSWILRYYIPNPYTKSFSEEYSEPKYFLKAIIEQFEAGISDNYYEICRTLFGEDVGNTNSLRSAINDYSDVMTIAQDGTIELHPNYKENMDISKVSRYDAKAFYNNFNMDFNFCEDIPEYIRQYTNLLKGKYNLVLTGAPGTGKTYLAKQIAALVVSNGQRLWDQLNTADKAKIGFTQFHPSYDYTDFVEGLRPDSNSTFVRTDGIFKSFCKKACDVEIIFNECYEQILEELQLGKLTLETDSKSIICRDGKLLVRSKDGRPAGEEKKSISIDKLLTLYKHCISNSIDESNFLSKDQATQILRDSGMDIYSADSYLLIVLKELLERSRTRIKSGKVADLYVFIIDEINRGELSKIFGELFYSIEPDYRGQAGRVMTQYANMIDSNDVFAEGFYIPENVLILGTMNDVDRGVEAMDFAIRRRFAWKEVTADESADNMGICGEAKIKMNAINDIIKKDLGSAYCIGGSYFRAYDNENPNATWENHLHGIIYEYYRGEPKVDEKVKTIRDAFFTAKEATNIESHDDLINNDESNN